MVPGTSVFLSSETGFSPGKEQAAGVWETCLAPGWPQLRSGLPFGPRSERNTEVPGTTSFELLLPS